MIIAWVLPVHLDCAGLRHLDKAVKSWLHEKATVKHGLIAQLVIT